MATLSRLWTPAGSSDSVNSIGDLSLISWLTCLKTVISFHLLSTTRILWLMMMFKQFSGCFWVRIILIILIWICSFGRDNCFYQFVAIVGSHFTFLSFSYKLPTQGFWTLSTCCNSWKQNDTIILHYSHTCLLFLFSWLQAWKPWVGSHIDGIKIVTGLLQTLLFMWSFPF